MTFLWLPRINGRLVATAPNLRGKVPKGSGLVEIYFSMLQK